MRMNFILLALIYLLVLHAGLSLMASYSRTDHLPERAHLLCYQAAYLALP